MNLNPGEMHRYEQQGFPHWQLRHHIQGKSDKPDVWMTSLNGKGNMNLDYNIKYKRNLMKVSSSSLLLLQVWERSLWTSLKTFNVQYQKPNIQCSIFKIQYMQVWERSTWTPLKTFNVHNDSVWDLRLHDTTVVSSSFSFG